MKKGLIFLVIWFVVIGSLIVLFYNMRVKQSFGLIREDTMNSLVLKEQIGDITKIKYNIFPKWIENKKGCDCVMFKVYTKDKKYNVCSIIKGLHASGYIIDNEIYLEEDN